MAWTAPRTWTTAEVVTAAIMNTHVKDNFDAVAPDGVTSASWTPVISGTSSGSTDAADAGREYRIGALQLAWAYWLDFNILAPLGGALGTLQLLLPATSSGVTVGSGGQVIGTWRYLDSSASGNSESGAVYLTASTTARFGRPVGNVVTNAVPITPAAGDTFSVYVCYPVA